MGKTYGVIHLVGAQNVPGNWGLLPPDARRLCAYQGVRNIRFLEHFACVLVEWSRGMLAWGLGCSGSGGVFCGLGSWGGVWGGFWFSCWVMHCGWGLISIFQEFFGSIGKVFILVWGLGAARLSFYGI